MHQENLFSLFCFPRLSGASHFKSPLSTSDAGEGSLLSRNFPRVKSDADCRKNNYKKHTFPLAKFLFPSLLSPLHLKLFPSRNPGEEGDGALEGGVPLWVRGGEPLQEGGLGYKTMANFLFCGSGTRREKSKIRHGRKTKN